jgi:cytochrome c-type biogenesis protein CcmH
MLWLGLALLTSGAVAAIVVPLLRGRKAAAPSRAAFDRAIYRDQLAELARDVERGVIDADHAAASRLEIERRLLAADATAESATSAAPLDGIAAVALAAAVSAGAIALYLALGSPAVRDQPLASRQDGGAVAGATRGPADMAAAVEMLAAKLKDRPDDAAGWLLLARSLATLQRWQDSAAAYQRALALTDGAEAAAGYGEMLVMAADGVVTPAARDAFATALTRDQRNPPARFYLALAEAQAGKPAAAIEAWVKLAGDAPPGAPWLPLVRQRIEETARAAGIAPPAAGVPNAAGPSAADVEAAQAMTPEERQAMIRAMVDRLAARLQANPEDAEGWQRLAKAYGVLGETKKAEEAASRAAALAKRQP